jgi:hypothetical protein
VYDYEALPETITIEAEAWDPDGIVVKVEFFANGEKFAEDVDGSDGWTTDALRDLPAFLTRDTQELIARATDDVGMTSDSAMVWVRVTRRPRR